MQIGTDLTIPWIGINDPLASLLHLTAACWFGWQAQSLVRRVGPKRRRAVALAMFAVSAVSVLTISGIYHSLSPSHPWKSWMQRADHAAIFLLIAATVTSFNAIGLLGRRRHLMVALVWLIAVASLVSKLALWASVGDGLEMALYIGVALVGGSSILLLPRALPWHAFVPVLQGGVIYGIGALTDLWAKGWVIPQVLGPHEIFHLAVIGGLFLHWQFFYRWALPALDEITVPAPIAVAAVAAEIVTD